MNPTLKTGLILALTLAVIGSGAVFLGSRLTPQAATPAAPKARTPLEATLPPLKVEGMNFSVREKGKPLWDFKAADLRQEKNGLYALNGLRQGVYYKDGKPYLTMKAANLTYDQVTKAVTMGGGVEVSGNDGLRFNAPSLLWDDRKKTILCNGPIQFRTENGWVTANRLTGDLKKQTFTLQQVSGEFSLDSGVKGVPL